MSDEIKAMVGLVNEMLHEVETSGLMKTLAQLLASGCKELEAAGFSRAEAMQLLLSDKFKYNSNAS